MRRSIRKRFRTSEPTKASIPSTPAPRLLGPQFWEKGPVCGLLGAPTSPALILSGQPANQLGERFLEESTSRRPRRRGRAKGRPERQQIMLRRGLALGGGLVLLILIVLGVKGCLDARAHRALSDYARNVSQIVEETQQRSKAFFGKLEDPG